MSVVRRRPIAGRIRPDRRASAGDDAGQRPCSRRRRRRPRPCGPGASVRPTTVAGSPVHGRRSRRAVRRPEAGLRRREGGRQRRRRASEPWLPALGAAAAGIRLRDAAASAVRSDRSGARRPRAPQRRVGGPTSPRSPRCRERRAVGAGSRGRVRLGGRVAPSSGSTAARRGAGRQGRAAVVAEPRSSVRAAAVVWSPMPPRGQHDAVTTSGRDRGGARPPTRPPRAPSASAGARPARRRAVERAPDQPAPGQLVERLDGEQRRDAARRARVGSRAGRRTLESGTWSSSFMVAHLDVRTARAGFPSTSASAARPRGDPGAHRPGGHVEHLGDLRVVEVAEVPQHDRDPELLGDLRERGVDVEAGVDRVGRWRRRRRRSGPAPVRRRRDGPALAAAGARRARRWSRRGTARW